MHCFVRVQCALYANHVDKFLRPCFYTPRFEKKK